jgi:putative SOS response-associated peptidase YedK
VPATSFCEYTDRLPKVHLGRRERHQEQSGGRFLTTEANEIVKPVHAKAMPVILTKPEEFDLWLSAPIAEALTLQRSPPVDALRVVMRGAKEDALAAA